ncbi:hypothetical protein CHGG_01917 [Chaetomium globosum CBS 148.51]|uniref:CTLH domain-containing protein n=1 Tax=Chaetomium globosum (strain ATCC 6205 / CBS 148.51 / DSM 1962 / NBRC 6347 / NRRL 1970) TaxID=306901 RepID=Q2HCY7_CHAGB|nr:uncharacterized protein CHGG_01917 [Chaetomium globosum CBS 148.51]EAQ93682.1 hypothetical protein CHGG_01917 [Chaetomium globosum CBS 148.51]
MDEDEDEDEDEGEDGDAEAEEAHTNTAGFSDVHDSDEYDLSSLHSQELQEKFAEMYTILQQLKAQNLLPAIEWARSNSAELEARGSNLEFELSKLQYVWLFKGPSVNNLPDDENNGRRGALAYARQHFGRFQARHLREIQQLASAMVFAPNLPDSPYHLTFASVSTAFTDVAASFTREFCSLLGLSAESPLYLAVTAGALALPRLMKFMLATRSKGTEWTTTQELPFETPLPQSMLFHSIFVCPVSKEQTTEDNPPMGGADSTGGRRVGRRAGLGHDGAYDDGAHQQGPAPGSGDVDVSLALVIDRVFDGLFQDADSPRPLESFLQPGGELLNAVSGAATSLPDPETLHGVYNTLDSWDAFFAYQQAVGAGERPVHSDPERHHSPGEMRGYRDSEELGVFEEAETDRERDPIDSAVTDGVRFLHLGVGWGEGDVIEADVDGLDAVPHEEFRIRYVEDGATLSEWGSESDSESE